MTKTEIYEHALQVAARHWGVKELIKLARGDVEKAIWMISQKFAKGTTKDVRTYGQYFLSGWSTTGPGEPRIDAMRSAGSNPIRVWGPAQSWKEPPMLLIPWAEVLRYAGTGKRKPMQINMFEIGEMQ